MPSFRIMFKQLVANQKASAAARRFLRDQDKISYFFYADSLQGNNLERSEHWQPEDALLNEEGEQKIPNLTVTAGGGQRGTRLLYIEGIIYQPQISAFKIRHFGVPIRLPSKRDIAALSLAAFALALQQRHGVQAIEFTQGNLIRGKYNWRQSYIDFFAYLGAAQQNAGNDSDTLHYTWSIPNAAPVLARPLPAWWRLASDHRPHQPDESGV